ncbi:MAG: helicase C-terminal domain-containing protein [Candidatus Eisenbacteria bacterium]
MSGRPHIHPPAIHPIDRFLGPGGALARVIPGYEAREAQLAFARDVADTLDGGGALLAEAPTGVGKSLGYLVPALLWSRREREPVVISTHTKQLQGQLTDVDLPLVAGAMDPAPRVVRLKGKGNYLCQRRWRLHVAEHKKRGARATSAETAAADWIAATPTGDLDEFDWSAHAGGPALRARVAFEPSFCTSACRPGGDCPWRRARRKAASAEIVVVNHALLVTGLPGSNVLPPYRALIVDEAHHLDAVLTAQLTVQQGYPRLERLLEMVEGERAPSAATAALAQVELNAATLLGANDRAELGAACDRLRALAPELRAAGRAFYTQVTAALALLPAPLGPYAPRARFRMLEELLGGAGYDALERTLLLARGGEEHGKAALAALSRGPQSPTLEDLVGDLAGIHGAWQEWHGGMRFLTDPRAGEHVYWRGGARAETAELAAAPIEVARHVRERLLPELSSLVLASATLATGGSFRYVRERLGLAEGGAFSVSERVYPSPFDFPRQLAAFVLDGRGEAERADIVARLVRTLGRNTLVLFTSHLALRAAAKRLRAELGDGVPVLAQDVDGSAVELARRFRRGRGTLLLGTASFWEGVDFPGEALEVLVVTQLPFPVPTEPLIEARCERVEAEHESGFTRVMLPEAVLRFRQGIGRLLRRATDRGVLAILDARVVEKSYGAHFRRGLPVALRAVASAEELTAQAGAFLEKRSGEVA